MRKMTRLLLLLGSLLMAWPGRVGGQEADTADERRAAPPGAASPRPVVPPGYFLFPIAPGQPNYLAANMGELRPNHFHGGLDIKTGGGVNKPVYASADGYISRLKQSSFGYGNVLYIAHPNGLTTVYGHLNAFRGPVAAELRRQQYEGQTYELELRFPPGRFPVARGEVVALSGNTGGSAGPHLHWEVRDAQDFQLNPLQWGGFPEIRDHVAPTLLALALEPLTIEARVNQRFAKAVLVPKVQPAPGAAFAWPDTIACSGTVGLLLQGFDRFDNAWNKNGIQRVAMKVNGQPFYQHTIDAVAFPLGTRQVANFLDFQYQYLDGRPLQKLWVDDGNDLGIYTATPAQGKLTVEPGRIYTVDLVLADSYNNQTPLRLVLRGAVPAYFKTRSALVKKPALRYEISRNILLVKAADPDTARQAANLVLWRGRQRLELRPSYCERSETTYLYDLRAGLPDSMRFGPARKKLDRLTLIPAGRETTYATANLNLVFGPESLFRNLYFTNAYAPEKSGSGFWTVGHPLTPLYKPIALTLTPPRPPADPRRTAIYSATRAGAHAYLGGEWDAQGRITAPLKQFGSFRILTDTLAPKGHLAGRAGGQVLFNVADELSGLATYRLLIGGQFRLLGYEHKKALLFTIAGDTLGPKLHGPAELRLTDRAGNERVIPLVL